MNKKHKDCFLTCNEFIRENKITDDDFILNEQNIDSNTLRQFVYELCEKLGYYEEGDEE